ncbi:MAG: hypothetical protein KDA63_14880, partial [Planctomycetales bacterium]|nr:hypothetical protein [Planctomycetales bacterium]
MARVIWFHRHTGRRGASDKRHSVCGLATIRLGTEPLEDRRMLAAVTVSNNLDVVNGDVSSIADLIADDGGDGIALREAIEAANNTLGADVIDFDVALAGGTIALSDVLGALSVSDSLTIDAASVGLVTVDASNGPDNVPGTHDGYRVFVIDDGDSGSTASVNIRALRLTGGDVDGPGGAVYSHEDISVADALIANNSAATDGGGVYVVEGQLTLSDSAVIGNSSGRSGGGVYNFVGGVDVVRTTMTGNSATRSGGGVANVFGTASIVESTVSSNTAGRAGGGVYTDYGKLTVARSTIAGNSA